MIPPYHDAGKLLDGPPVPELELDLPWHPHKIS